MNLFPLHLGKVVYGPQNGFLENWWDFVNCVYYRVGTLQQIIWCQWGLFCFDLVKCECQKFLSMAEDSVSGYDFVSPNLSTDYWNMTFLSNVFLVGMRIKYWHFPLISTFSHWNWFAWMELQSEPTCDIMSYSCDVHIKNCILWFVTKSTVHCWIHLFCMSKINCNLIVSH